MSVTKPTTVRTVVDSATTLTCPLDSIATLPVDPPSLYFDLEGVRFSRLGSIFLISLYVAPRSETYLIDVHLLRGETFSTLSSNSGHSLKKVLENPNIPKVFFDCRNDSDALYSHFQISLDGCSNLQQDVILEIT